MVCTRSTSSTLAILAIVAIFATIATEATKGPDISIVRPPNCWGKSKNNGYNKSVATLLDLLLQETKNAHRRENSDYRYLGSYPDSYPGSATGAGSCDKDLGKSECWGCLVAARRKLADGCEDPVKASVKLRDCALWFDKIC